MGCSALYSVPSLSSALSISLGNVKFEKNMVSQESNPGPLGEMQEYHPRHKNQELQLCWNLIE